MASKLIEEIEKEIAQPSKWSIKKSLATPQSFYEGLMSTVKSQRDQGASSLRQSKDSSYMRALSGVASGCDNVLQLPGIATVGSNANLHDAKNSGRGTRSLASGRKNTTVGTRG